MKIVWSTLLCFFISFCRYDVVRMQRAVAGRTQGIYFAVMECFGFWDAVHFHCCFHSEASGIPAGHKSTTVCGQLHWGEWSLWGYTSSRNRVFYLWWVKLFCNTDLNLEKLVGCTSVSKPLTEYLHVFMFITFSNHFFLNIFVSTLFKQ